MEHVVVSTWQVGRVAVSSWLGGACGCEWTRRAVLPRPEAVGGIVRRCLFEEAARAVAARGKAAVPDLQRGEAERHCVDVDQRTQHAPRLSDVTQVDALRQSIPRNISRIGESVERASKHHVVVFAAIVSRETRLPLIG